MRKIVLLLALISPAHAALVTYEYHGADFDFIVDPTIDPTVIHNPWSDRTQNRITGRITFDTDYLAGGSLENASFAISAQGFAEKCGSPGCSGTAIHDYAFFDGVYEWNVTDRNYEFIAWQDFTFSTDSAGNIVSWVVDLAGDPSDMVLSSRSGDRRRDSRCGEDPDRMDQLICASASGKGSWTRVAIPEPGAWGLGLAAGLLVLLLGRRRASLRESLIRQ